MGAMQLQFWFRKRTNKKRFFSNILKIKQTVQLMSYLRENLRDYLPFWFIQNWETKIKSKIIIFNSRNQKKTKKKMQKISNTVIRNSLEQHRIKVIAWLISNLSDVLKFFCFSEIQSLNGLRVVSEIINWSADVNGRSTTVGLKYKN